MEKSNRRDVYLDEKNWEKLGILSDLSPGKPSHSALIRDAIDYYLKQYEEKIKVELRNRAKDKGRKLVKISKEMWINKEQGS